MNSAMLSILFLVVAVFSAEATMTKQDRAKCISQVKDIVSTETDSGLKGKIENSIAMIFELHEIVKGFTDVEKTNLISNYFTGVCVPISAFF